jgi:multidrug efflux pump subunit AcrB
MNKIIESISHFFADNRSLTILVIITSILFGLMSFGLMPKQYNPEIIRPAFLISLDYSDSNPEDAHHRILTELIEKIQVIPEVDDVYTSITDGSKLYTTVIFKVGENKISAKTNLRNQIASHSHFEGGNIKNVTIQEINPETIPIMQVVFQSSNLSLHELRTKVLNIRQSLLSIPGVSEVTVRGGSPVALLVDVDPYALANNDISITQLESHLTKVGQRRTLSTHETDTVSTPSRISFSELVPAQVGLFPITKNVLLQDVATVYEGTIPITGYTRTQEKDFTPTDAIIIGIAKTEGTSAPKVSEAVKTYFAENVSRKYDNVNISIVADDGKVATDEIYGLTMNLITSIVIVALVLFFFLSPRAALVVLITIPLTFLIVLGIGYISGETINRITLFALILSLGLLVDSSIVVVDIIYENIKRAERQGRKISLAKVASEAVSEVGPGLLISTVTSVVVFLPMNFITGMMGPYMGPISFFVPVALITSLLVAVVVTPFIAISILRTNEREWWITKKSQSFIKEVTLRYSHLIRKIVSEEIIRKRLLRTTTFIFIVILIFPAVGAVHFQMLPKADRDQFYIYIDLPKGTGREVTKKVTEEVSAIILTAPDVISTQSFIADAPIVDFNGLFKGVQHRIDPEQATVRVNITEKSTRKKTSTEIVTDLRAVVKVNMPEAYTHIRFMEELPGPPVRATFEAKITASKTGEAEHVALQFVDRIGQIKGITDRFTSVEAEHLTIDYKVDEFSISNFESSADDIILWNHIVSGNHKVKEVLLPDTHERTHLILTTNTQYRVSSDLFLGIPLATENDNVTIASFVDRSYIPHTPTRHYENATPVTYVTAEVEGVPIIYTMLEVIKILHSEGIDGYKMTSWNLFSMTLSNNEGEVVTFTWGGEWEMTLENFRDLGIAMMIALFLVYSILVAQYRSFSIPGFILITVPLGLIGIIIGFTVLDQLYNIYLTATALIGFIALIGIVVNNAIIYLEYVMQSQEEGLDYKDALVAAGTLRLRPILLTSLTTILGSLTIASDPVWSGLAWSIVFGLSLSTILTLIILPSFLASINNSK